MQLCYRNNNKAIPWCLSWTPPQTFHLVLFAAEEVENNIKAAAGQLDKELNLHTKLCRQPELQIQLIIFCSQRRLPPSEHQIMIMMSHNEPHECNTRTNVHVQSVFADLALSWQRNTKLPVTPWGGTIEETLTSASDVWQVSRFSWWDQSLHSMLTVGIKGSLLFLSIYISIWFIITPNWGFNTISCL